MPYSTSTSTEECDGVAVVKDSSGEVMGCHDTEEEAQEQIAAIEASENSRLAKKDIDTTPTEAMQDAARRGLEVHEEGKSGDGLEGATVREAQSMAAGEALTEAKVRKGNAFWGRNDNYCNDGASDAQITSRLLWGGCGSIDWFNRKHEQFEKAEADGRMSYTTEDTFTLTRSQLEALAPGVADELLSTEGASRAVSAQAIRDRIHALVNEANDDDMWSYVADVFIESVDGNTGVGYVIIEDEGEMYKAVFTANPDEVTLAPREEWVEVQAAYEEVADMEEDEGEGGRLLPESIMTDVEKEFKQWEDGFRDVKGEHRSLVGASIRQTGDKREWTVQIMTEDIARDGMILRADGVQTDAYEKNPVVLWNHGMSAHDMPIARCTQLIRKDGAILAKVKFDRSDEFAKEIERKLKDGYINAVSIGWRTEDSSMEEVDGRRVPVVTKADMTEFSFVSVGADAEALAQRKYDGEEDMDRMMKEYKRMYDDLRAHCMERMDEEEMEERGMLDMMRMYMQEELDMPKRMKDDEQEGDMPERSDTSDPATAGSPSRASGSDATAPGSDATDRDEEIVDTYEVDSLDDLWDMIDQIADRKLGRA